MLGRRPPLVRLQESSAKCRDLLILSFLREGAHLLMMPADPPRVASSTEAQTRHEEERMPRYVSVCSVDGSPLISREYSGCPLTVSSKVVASSRMIRTHQGPRFLLVLALKVSGNVIVP